MTGSCEQAPSTSSGRKCFDAIRKWVKWLADNHCFCPDSLDRPFDADTNVRCYVSSPGNLDGGLSEAHDVKNILRFTPTQRAGRSNAQVLAELTFQVYGGELVRFCHFGTEACIIERLVEKLQGFKVDLRPVLGGAPVYHTKKHIEKLGLQRELPGLCSQSHDKPDVFMKLGVWKSGGGGISSEGMGVNMWALLTAASLVGCNHIHCKASSRISQALLSQILKSAPSAATPGNIVPVRSFHEVSKEVESVVVKAKRRPENFLRPIDDGNFAMNGIFSYCPVVDGEMPEDYLGCGYVREMSKFLKCKYEDVPPQHVHGHYQLVPGRHYCIYSKERDLFGSLCVREDDVEVVLSDDTGMSWEFDKWEDMLVKHRFLVMPMVWRSGALVDLGGGSVGCLVPDGTRASMAESGCPPAEGDFVSNYDHVKFCYHARKTEEKLVSMGVLGAMDKLVPPGTFLWIKPETDSWEGVADKLPEPSSLSQEDACRRMIRVRLNVPLSADPAPGKVHVTVVQKSDQASHTLDFTFSHLVVDPWELSLEQPSDVRLEVRELLG